MVTLEEKETVKSWIDESEHLVFFGGAGVSTESGIPDFRSEEGLYATMTKYGIPAERILSRSFFEEHPEIFFEYSEEFIIHPEAKPNVTHEYLAELEKIKDVTIVTQNIDGLHQLAGSQKVDELHGNTFRFYCLKAHHHYHYNDLQRDDKGIPRCPKDGSMVRPDIVMYEEPLNEEIVRHAVKAISKADLLIIGGTSLSVYPAAGFIQYFRGKHLIAINKSKLSSLKGNGVLNLESSLGEIFSYLKEELNG